MIEYDTWQKLIVVVTDKGFLALILALTGLFISRSIERFKTNLSWSSELLKQRMDIAKEIVCDFKKLEETHTTLVMQKAYIRDHINMQEFIDTRNEYLEHLRLAQLAFPKAVMTCLETVESSYKEFLVDENTPACSIEEEEARKSSEYGDLSRLSPEEIKWQGQKQKKLDKDIKIAMGSMRNCFPNEVKL